MKLLLDIGNTRLKWAVHDQKGLAAGKPIVHGDCAFKQQLLAAWRGIQPRPEVLAVSCVGSETVLDLAIAAAHDLWPGVAWFRATSEASAGGVVNGYEYPRQLGVDRWLCLLAARRLCSEAVCIVDCGTAITVDVMAATGHHLGGLIAPGLTAMREALAQNTANLSFSAQVFPAGLAHSTEAAIYNGSLYAAVGLINSVCQPGGALKLILTGGDAQIIAGHFGIDVLVVPDLVLQGLSLN
ncbi:MAG: type III pantothenate kinase [Gammaproteobacteria bacterium HGW-Gammaproteobacteria-3]|nr:MAG: type III pantothenate kinase [Gammaproteobacteria bacterium HGW-Gammaproteobacteria-3]